LTGIGENLPPITGLIVTTLKKDDSVELVLAAGAGKHELPLLAVRQYGKGRVAVLTTDAGKS
jgi:uncharacterized membrane protein